MGTNLTLTDIEDDKTITNYPELYKTIREMSKQTAWLWWMLVELRDRKTNIAVYAPIEAIATVIPVAMILLKTGSFHSFFKKEIIHPSLI